MTSPEDTTETRPPDGRVRSGFASMTPERLREVGHRGGTRVQALGTAHRFTSEELRTANRKSVQARRARIPYAKKSSGGEL